MSTQHVPKRTKRISCLSMGTGRAQNVTLERTQLASQCREDKKRYTEETTKVAPLERKSLVSLTYLPLLSPQCNALGSLLGSLLGCFGVHFAMLWDPLGDPLGSPGFGVENQLKSLQIIEFSC